VWDGRYDEAIAMYETLPPSFPRRAYLMRNIAKAYYEKKKYSEAFSLYDAVLKETPSD
jgi:tetratricopeptide (TPR) repeat protein